MKRVTSSSIFSMDLDSGSNLMRASASTWLMAKPDASIPPRLPSMRGTLRRSIASVTRAICSRSEAATWGNCQGMRLVPGTP